MGIPRYFGSVVSNLKHVVRSGYPSKCKFLCIDFNAMIHPVVRKANENGLVSREVMFESIFTDLRRVVDLCSPERVFVAHDGVCPYAKVVQQRRRRFLGRAERGFKGEPEPPFDSVHISPGTEFSDQLTSFIRTRCDAESWVYSGADVEGEGEHKIFKFLKLYATDGDDIVIHGLDADMILLSLCSRLKNIKILREDKEVKHIDVDLLRLDIGKTIDESDIQNAVDSYCFMMSVCGNDFLPRMPGMSVDEDTVGRIVRCIRGNVFTRDGGVDMGRLWEVVRKLALEEDAYVRTANAKYIRSHSFMGDRLPISHLAFKMGLKTWRVDYHAWFCRGIDSDTTSQVSMDYVKGMMFVWDYYTSHGKYTDWRWFYPWNHAPSMLEISNYIPTFSHTPRYEKAVSVDVQMLSIVPSSSRHVLPERLRSAYDRIAHLHPHGVSVCSYGVYKFHEIIPFLPPISPDMIS